MSLKRSWLVAVALLATLPLACSGGGHPPVPNVSPGPTGSAGPTPTPTPSPGPTGSAHITGSLTAIVVCAQLAQTCADDLNPAAASGEEVVVFVAGVTGNLTLSNSGGATVGTLTKEVYATQAGTTEYKVTYTSATTTPATDMVTIFDFGTNSSLTIPVTIISPGLDGGPSFFSLQTTSGTVCPGNEITFGTRTKGNATITLAASDATLLTIAQNGGSNFVLNLLRAGSGQVTATAGQSSVVYPVNIPAPGFTSSC